MAQLFHRSSNTLSKVSIFAVLFLIAGALAFLYAYHNSDYMTYVDVPREQPVQFTHEHHVAGLGIDCRYCHTSVEKSSFAGIPPTETCMSCHSQIWTNAAILAPIRESFRTGIPVKWTRVHDLPDYVFFNHSIHVAKGIGCESCHGRVDKMPLMWKANTLYMQWCLSCHRDPAKNIRPRDQIVTMGYKPSEDQAVLGPKLVNEYHVNVKQLTNCSICHR
ncbi:MAG TPA: cytochrome c3 family protein [Candidatus Kapabacteria bacterium]|nr:cytochrome c3 family protein [Candidatus Kapabacteria bacterium]